MKNAGKRLIMAMAFGVAFILWTWILCVLDVQTIGPNGTAVGLATLNGVIHRLTGVCMPVYTITDWLGLVPVAIGFGFALLGLSQWLRRKSLFKVDWDLLALGGFYLLMLAVYLLFETVVINYRPVLINGYLEVSYPSSTTLLVLCVMPTTWLQLQHRMKRGWLLWWLKAGIVFFIVFMVAGRLLAGVHWLTDIVGGSLLAACLVNVYAFVCDLKKV